MNAPYFMGNGGVDTPSTAYTTAVLSRVLQAGQVQQPLKLVNGFVTNILPTICAQLKLRRSPWSILSEKNLSANDFFTIRFCLASFSISLISKALSDDELFPTMQLSFQFTFSRTASFILLMYSLIEFQPIVILTSKYMKETRIGIGSPVVWMTNEVAMHHNMKIKYHLPKVVWQGCSLGITLLRRASRPVRATRYAKIMWNGQTQDMQEYLENAKVYSRDQKEGSG